MFAMQWDIMCTIGQLSQFNTKLWPKYLNAAKRVLLYLKWTSTLSIITYCKPPMKLSAFSNANRAGDINTCRSTTGYVDRGYVEQWRNCAIAWKSKCQTISWRCGKHRWLKRSWDLRLFRGHPPSPHFIACTSITGFIVDCFNNLPTALAKRKLTSIYGSCGGGKGAQVDAPCPPGFAEGTSKIIGINGPEHRQPGCSCTRWERWSQSCQVEAYWHSSPFHQGYIHE